MRLNSPVNAMHQRHCLPMPILLIDGNSKQRATAVQTLVDGLNAKNGCRLIYVCAFNQQRGPGRMISSHEAVLNRVTLINAALSDNKQHQHLNL
jgi:hypothetical protein